MPSERWPRVNARMPVGMIDRLDLAAEEGNATNRSDALRHCVRTTSNAQLGLDGRDDHSPTRCVECGSTLDDPKNCGDPDVEGDWVCCDPVCRAMHDVEMECERTIHRLDANPDQEVSGDA